MVTVMHVGAMSLFVGALYGGVIHSRVAYMNFIKNNQATAFNDHLEAKVSVFGWLILCKIRFVTETSTRRSHEKFWQRSVEMGVEVVPFLLHFCARAVYL